MKKSTKRNIKKYAALFTVGGSGYALIEYLWRGRTHWTMVIAGGVCFICFSVIADKFQTKSLVFKSSLCALSVTAVELIFGIVFNLVFKMNVWDYSSMPLNFLGQICALFTLLWGGLGMLFIPLAELMNEKLA